MKPASKIEPAKPLPAASPKKRKATPIGTALVSVARKPSVEIGCDVDRLPPDLRDKYERLDALFRRQSRSCLDFYYQVGLVVKDIRDDDFVTHPTCRRMATMSALANSLKVSSRLLYQARKLVETFTPQQYAELTARRQISWGHITQLIQVDPEDRRQQLIERVVAEELTAEELVYEIGGASKKKPRGPGRKPKPPRNVPHALQKTIGFSNSYLKFLREALFGDAYHLPSEIVNLPPDKMSPEIRRQLEQAIVVLDNCCQFVHESIDDLRKALALNVGAIGTRNMAVEPAQPPTRPLRHLMSSKFSNASSGATSSSIAESR